MRTWHLALLLAALGVAACGPHQPSAPTTCAGEDCSGHGSCTEVEDAAMCVCETGYAGVRCEGCASDYMPMGGACVPNDPCAVACGNLHRECLSSGPDPMCGACVEGFFEAQGRCYEQCAASDNVGELIPLDLYVMLDRSSSMQEGSKWSAVTAALNQFASSPDTAGIGLGLAYFPVDPSAPIPSSCADCGLYGPCLPGFNVCAGSLSPDTSCDPGDYDDADVAIQELPGVLAAFQASLSGHDPEGSATPSEPAMAGAVTYATAWAQAHADHVTFIVFATDGEPTGCSTNSVAGTAALAAGAAAGTPEVKTFVIGVGSSLDSLNEIAAAGGTGSAFLVDTGGDVTQGFIDALNDIRENRQCKYQLPVPPGGGMVDPLLVNVNVGTPPQPVYYVTSESACDPALGGWYYDDPAAPTVILLCPATCEQVTAGDLAVSIAVGCETIVL